MAWSAMAPARDNMGSVHDVVLRSNQDWEKRCAEPVFARGTLLEASICASLVVNDTLKVSCYY